MPVGPIKRALAQAEAAGIAVSVDELERQSLCDGDKEAVVQAMIYAKSRGKLPSFLHISAANLAGWDLRRFVDQDYREQDA